MTDSELKNFIVRAKRATYASGNGPEASEKKASRNFSYKEGDLGYLDSCYGGLQLLGQEVVWQGDEPVWGMNYWGEALDTDVGRSLGRSDASDVANGEGKEGGAFDLPAFLKEALMLVSEESPYRGPSRHRRRIGEVDAVYRCNVTGDLSGFEGDEAIVVEGRAVYHLFFHGGRIRD